jgi:D-lyxose ketol-isomerase
MKFIRKVWGSEEIWHNEDFCVKEMKLEQCAECSIHFHAIKKEMFIAICGAIRIELWDQLPVAMQFAKSGVMLPAKKCGIDLAKPDKVILLGSYPKTQFIYIDNYVPHRFIGLSEINVFIEASTYDDPHDSYRFTQSRKAD